MLVVAADDQKIPRTRAHGGQDCAGVLTRPDRHHRKVGKACQHLFHGGRAGGGVVLRELHEHQRRARGAGQLVDECGRVDVVGGEHRHVSTQMPAEPLAHFRVVRKQQRLGYHAASCLSG
ncbi:MAG: hypothetical protein L0H83_11820 [Salinisphaera sp.]|nr:hypothetical protein [Salinisphaera sp.]